MPTKDTYPSNHSFLSEEYIHKQLDIYSEESNTHPKSQVMTKLQISPGLIAELEFELRQYARTHQACLDTKVLGYAFTSLDRYGTGKLLPRQVRYKNLCYIVVPNASELYIWKKINKIMFSHKNNLLEDVVFRTVKLPLLK